MCFSGSLASGKKRKENEYLVMDHIDFSRSINRIVFLLKELQVNKSGLGIRLKNAEMNDIKL